MIDALIGGRLHGTAQHKTGKNDRPFVIAKIRAAALRWFTARQRRMTIGTEQRQYQQARKAQTGFGGSDSEISHRHQQAKRLELAAARALAKACEQHRDNLNLADDAIEIVEARMVAFEP
jgi:hypothetical protein